MALKLVRCLKRLDILTRPQFQEYWQTVHAPLILCHQRVFGFSRYVQNHTLDGEAFRWFVELYGGQQIYDGVVELWFESADVWQKAASSPAAATARAEILADESNFLDASRSPVWFAREHEP